MWIIDIEIVNEESSFGLEGYSFDSSLKCSFCSSSGLYHLLSISQLGMMNSALRPARIRVPSCLGDNGDRWNIVFRGDI